MPTERKIEAVSEMQEWMKDCAIIVSTNYLGLPVDQMTSLRRALRQKDVRYRIVKNTLALLAADAAGRPKIKEIIQGPTGFAFNYGDPTETAKALADFIRESRADLIINGAVMGDRALTAEEVQQLATLPSREVLLSRLLGQMQAPISGLVRVLNGPIAGLARVLQAHIDDVGLPTENGAASPTEDSIESPADDGDETVADDGVESPVEDSVEQPAEDSIVSPADDNVDQPTDDGVEQPAEDQKEE